MSQIKPRIGFAAVDCDGMIMPWSVAALAKQVRDNVGDSWINNDNPTRKDGWENARKCGYKIIKIKISQLKE